MKAQCCAAVPTGHRHQICGQPAVKIARMPGWTRSASSFCADHPPTGGWVILATNEEGFEIDFDQPAGTPAYFGITAPTPPVQQEQPS